jgi:hypothetical protein
MASISEIKSSITFGGGLARNNQFLVTLPSLGFGIPPLGGTLGGLAAAGLDFLGQRNMNILCRSAQIPGKQVLTHDRRIGMESQKVAYGYAVDDVTLTFLETSTLPIRRYFDTWRSLTINEETQTAAYKKDYEKRVLIHQLAQPVPIAGFSISNLIPATVMISTYSVELVNAFPTTMVGAEYNNEQDGFIETTVQLSYTNWKRVPAGQLSFSLNF